VMETILLVEDHNLIRELVQEMLELAGYKVMAARDHDDAFRMMEEATPNLILLDIQLPGLDGYAVLRHLRGDLRFNKIPVIALTAYAMDDDRQKGLEAGFDGYLTKPIERILLLESIQALLAKRRSSSMNQSLQDPRKATPAASMNPSS
jgi:CheY-like chemotaxis protein